MSRRKLPSVTLTKRVSTSGSNGALGSVTPTGAQRRSSMPTNKVILLVQATVKPEHRDLIVAAANENLPQTLAEAGVESFYQTVQQDDPDTVVFFEVFKSETAHDLHMQQEYTKKVCKRWRADWPVPPVVTRLIEL